MALGQAMGGLLVLLDQFGGGSAELAISATSFEQNAMDRVHVLIVLVSERFSGLGTLLMGSRIRFGV